MSNVCRHDIGTTVIVACDCVVNREYLCCMLTTTTITTHKSLFKWEKW